MTDEELKRFEETWQPLSLKLEKAILEVLKSRSDYKNSLVLVTALASASARLIDAIEKESNMPIMMDAYKDVLDQAYSQYQQIDYKSESSKLN